MAHNAAVSYPALESVPAPPAVVSGEQETDTAGAGFLPSSFVAGFAVLGTLADSSSKVFATVYPWSVTTCEMFRTSMIKTVAGRAFLEHFKVAMHNLYVPIRDAGPHLNMACPGLRSAVLLSVQA